MSSYLLLFIFGGIMGATFDSFHTHSGTDAYYHPQFFMMEWWVPPLFGFATLAIARAHLVFDKHFARQVNIKSLAEITTGFVLFALQYYASGFMKVDPVPRTVFQGVFAFSLWFVFDGTFGGVILAILTALTGSLVEILLIHYGWFYYVLPDIGADMLGIPLWLPFLYVSGSVTVGNLARKIFARNRIFRF